MKKHKHWNRTNEYIGKRIQCYVGSYWTFRYSQERKIYLIKPEIIIIHGEKGWGSRFVFIFGMSMKNKTNNK